MIPSQKRPLSILFIGGGNMAQAMISGLLKSEALLGVSIQVIEPDAGSRELLAQRWGGRVTVVAQCDPKALSQASFNESFQAKVAQPAPDWIVLAVKPQQAQEALIPIAQQAVSWPVRPRLLSIAAGVTMGNLMRWSGLTSVVRTMPNTPAMVQQGITGACGIPGISAEAREQAQAILESLGTVVWLEEEVQIDAITAVSGSGPAYVFYFLEAFAAAGERLGLSSAQSELLAFQTMKGSLALLEQSRESPSQLRAKVTSKGGTTAAAIAVLQAEPGGLSGLMVAAVAAAHQRAQELARQ
jgi:pyrroline-5-carboxylate reductase